jgi:hypothetical protein
MFPFVLYAVTAAVSGYHVYFLLTLGMFGVPQSASEYISLAMSACLLICAYISVYRPVQAAKIGLVAALGMWIFYGPAIISTIRAGQHRQLPSFQLAALPYLAVLLLVLTTSYTFMASGRKDEGAGTRLFPIRTTRWGRIMVGTTTVIMVVGLSMWFAVGGRGPIRADNSRRATSKFLIPDGYVGWVRIEFQVAGVPAIATEDGENVFHIPADGKLETSSPEQFGWSNDEYFYLTANGPRTLPTAGKGRMVWGKINGERGLASGKQQYEEFFVGTEEQFREMAGASGAGVKNSTVRK